MALKIIFAGTPAFALPSLQALLHSPHKLVAVYTQPDRPFGRGKKLMQSPIKTFAMQHKVPCFQPANFKLKSTISQFQSLKADVMIVAAYGLILPKSILNTPPHGCINVHASLLPRWRGAAPIQYAILKGDDKTGITLMQMNEGLDTGDILSVKTVSILKDDTFQSLHDKLAVLGAKALMELLPALEKHQLKPQPQDDRLARYAPKVKKEDGAINWHASAVEIDRKIRAFNPYPGAYSTFGSQSLRILQAKVIFKNFPQTPGTIILQQRAPMVITGEYALELLSVQLPGKKIISGYDFVNAYCRDVKTPIQLT